MTGISEALQRFFRSPRYSVKQIGNVAAPSNAVAIDLTSANYSPGTPFVVLNMGASAGTVKVIDICGTTSTIPNVASGSRVGQGYGLVCTTVVKTGTTATGLFALS